MRGYLIPILVGYLLGCMNPAPLFNLFFKKQGKEQKASGLTAYNMTVSYGLVPGAVTGLVRFALPQLAAFYAIIFRHCDFQLALLLGCAVLAGEVFPFYALSKGDSGLFGYTGLVLAGMIFVGPWVLVAAGFLAGSVNCMVLFVLTLAIACPVLLTCVQLPLMYLIPIVSVSVLVVARNLPRALRVLKKQEPKITDLIREVYKVIEPIN